MILLDTNIVQNTESTMFNTFLNENILRKYLENEIFNPELFTINLKTTKFIVTC